MKKTKKQFQDYIKKQVRQLNDCDYYTYYDIINNHFYVHAYKDNKRYFFDIPLNYFKSYDTKHRNPKIFPLFQKDKNGKYTEIKTNEKYKKQKLNFFDFKKKKKFLLNNKNDKTAFLKLDEKVLGFNEIFKKEIKDDDIKKPKIAFFDIEASMSEGAPYDNIEDPKNKITTITLYNNKDNKFHVFSYKDFDEINNTLNSLNYNVNTKRSIINRFKNIYKNVIKHCYKNEKEMLKNFIKHVRKSKFDIISGWNCQYFDIPYIYNRCLRLLGEEETNKLSIYNKIEYFKIRDNPVCDIKGLSIIDYRDLYKKLSNEKVPNYKLDTIAQHELKIEKIDFEGNYDELYENDFNKYILYNIQDVNILKELDDKLEFIFMNMVRCFKGKINFDRGVNLVALIHEYCVTFRLLDNKNVYANDIDYNENRYLKGAHTEAVPGFFQFLISKDFTSLYPSIVMKNNISVETKLGKNNNSNEIIDTLYKNIKYTKDFKGVLVKYIEDNFYKRLEYKKLKKTDKENFDRWSSYDSIYKIHINSAYGFLCYKNSYYFDYDSACVITKTARHLIKLMKEYIEKIHRNKKILNKFYNINKNIYERKTIVPLIDTDSNYINLYPLWNKIKDNKNMINKIKNKVDEKYDFEGDDFEYFVKYHDEFIINPVIKKVLYDFSDRLNMIDSDKNKELHNVDFEFEYENSLRSDLILTKKKYVYKPYKSDKLKVTGLETIKSDSSRFVRNEINNFFLYAVNSFEKYGLNKKCNCILNKKLKEIKNEYKHITDLTYIGEPVNVNTFNNWLNGNFAIKKGANENVKALFNYNLFIDNLGLKKFRKGKQGDKIKIWKVNPNNKFNIEVIGCPIEIEKDFIKEFKKYFEVNKKKLWKKRAKGMIDRLYDVVNFNKNISFSQKSILNDFK